MCDRICSLEFYLFTLAWWPLWDLFFHVKLWRHNSHRFTVIKHAASCLPDMFFSWSQLLPWCFTLSDWILPWGSTGELRDLPWPTWLLVIIAVMCENTVEEVTVVSVHLPCRLLRYVDALCTRHSSEVNKRWWSSDHTLAILGSIAWWLICERLIVRTIASNLTLVYLVNPLWTCSLIENVWLIVL